MEKISAKKLIVPVDKSTGVEIIYSDSAHVKAKLITPELLSFKTEKPYIEMRKGVTVIFLIQIVRKLVGYDLIMQFDGNEKIGLNSCEMWWLPILKERPLNQMN